MQRISTFDAIWTFSADVISASVTDETALAGHSFDNAVLGPDPDQVTATYVEPVVIGNAWSNVTAAASGYFSPDDVLSAGAGLVT